VRIRYTGRVPDPCEGEGCAEGVHDAESRRTKSTEGEATRGSHADRTVGMAHPHMSLILRCRQPTFGPGSMLGVLQLKLSLPETICLIRLVHWLVSYNAVMAWTGDPFPGSSRRCFPSVMGNRKNDSVSQVCSVTWLISYPANPTVAVPRFV